MLHEQHLRDYLTRDEVASLLRAAKKSPRHATRNHAMILIAYRHGLRASEVVNLRVSDLDAFHELAQNSCHFKRFEFLDPIGSEFDSLARNAGRAAGRIPSKIA